jgi:catechol 2,3-dioxygenase-like lactoylglutathione lyase family enzyme
MNAAARDFAFRLLCSVWVLAIAASAPARADDLPLVGLAHVELRVTDLEQARKFYHELLGFEKPFEASGTEGTSGPVAFYKVNDRQFIELVSGLKPDVAPAMTHIAMATDDVDRLRTLLVGRGLAVSPMEISPRDGSRSCALRTLPGQNLGALEFVEYGPESLESKARGKALGVRRISQRLEHAGIIATDFAAARKFYIDTLGFQEMWSRSQPDGTPVLNHLRLPGPSGDYIELSNRPKPISRIQAGTAAHISLEVPEIRAAQKEVLARAADANLKEPRFGLDQRWQFNLFDPDGTRVERMQPRARSPT